MNDNNIIKALGCCISCSECPYYKCGDRCVEKRDADIIDLINRQKAEIKKLKQDVDEARCEYTGLQIDKDEMFNESVALIKNAGIKAIKEFVEKLNKQAFCVQQTEWEGRVVDCEDIDSLVKEMTEEHNGNV